MVEKKCATTSSWGPPPPLKMLPNETIFHVLCVGSNIGGIIGKGGSVIKPTRQETGAKIRIEEGVLDYEERVIVIVAPEKDIEGDKEKPVGREGNGQTKETTDRSNAAKGQNRIVVEEKGAGSEKDIKKKNRISLAQETLLRVSHCLFHAVTISYIISLNTRSSLSGGCYDTSRFLIKSESRFGKSHIKH